MWVEGIQRIVCGVTEKTTCQDVVYALAHATGKTGRFTLIERWRNNERLLAPQEHPLKVLAKWGEYSNDVQFILQRSPLDASKAGGEAKTGQMKKSSTFSGQMNQAAIWKAPPGAVSSKQPMVSSLSTGRLQDTARLSPDSGRGSDPTGSDTSNFSDQEKVRGGGSQQLSRPNLSGYTPPGWQVRSARFTSPSPDRGGENYGYSGASRCLPPAYRPPPQPGSLRNSSPASDPPPYREPPPPPGSSRTGNKPPRPPHYSPPPQHRELRGHKGPSPGRNPPSHNTRVSASPSRGQSWLWPPRYTSQSPNQTVLPKSDYADLMSLVQAQQTRMQSQQAEIKHCDNELKYWDGSSGPGPGPGAQAARPVMSDFLPAQLEAVMVEVKMLEEAAIKNEEELQVQEEGERGGSSGGGIRGELDQLKHRLEMTDIELQKTNSTLRRLGEEMRSYSMEKSKEKEEELRSEVDRIQSEIKILQKTNEDSATISDKLSREVQEVENQIMNRKGEVEKLIQDMKSANLESLTISPPEESKTFLDDVTGPAKPGTTRKMLGSPRQLENAVPTSKNPHGVWV